MHPASRWWLSSAPRWPTPSPAGSSDEGADSDEAIYLVSTLIVGVLSQALANEPDLEWGEGRFTPLLPKLLKLLVAVYPVTAAR